MNLSQKYKKSQEENWSLRFRLIGGSDTPPCDGIVQSNQRRFVVLCEQSDFEFDGLVVLPKGVIRGYRDGKFERCCNQIIRQNGAIEKARAPRWLKDCERMSEVLVQLKQRDIWPLIQAITDSLEVAFYPGPVVSVQDQQVNIRCYDATGKWDGIYKLNIDDIFRIDIENRYCQSFNAFMRTNSPCPISG